MRVVHLTVLVLIGLVVSGCSSQSDPTPAGQAVLLETEPSNAQDVADFKSSFGMSVELDGEATIVGRVRGGGTEPWDTTQATFLLTSASLESHGHGGGDHSNCKFCQAKELESLILVRVVDDSGSIIQTDARELLGISENQVVVAQGKGTLDGDALLFDASRLFIRE